MESKLSFIKKTGLILISLLIIAAAFAGGIYVGFNKKPLPEKLFIKDKEPQSESQASIDFSLFWDVWGRLEKKYVDKGKIDREKFVLGAIDGMVKSLGDPYTVFMPPEESKRFSEEIHGEFGGIGAEIGFKKGILTIIAPLKDSPAEKAGLLAGDKILKINSTSTVDLTVERAVSFIRGEKGTEVVLTISRDDWNEAKEIKIKRDTIHIPVIDTKKLGDNIFYIHLFNFNENASVEFRKGLMEFQNSGAQKLVLDLRNNPGGYLNAAVEIGSWFLPAGEIVAKERRADGQELPYRSNGYRFLEKVPVVVLINQGSASASEILAGALRDKRGIKLIGEKSFGKGSVQEVEELPKNASLKITISKWLTPNGYSINDAGLEPDIKVEIKKEDIDKSKDPPLDKAIEILKSISQ